MKVYLEGEHVPKILITEQSGDFNTLILEQNNGESISLSVGSNTGNTGFFFGDVQCIEMDNEGIILRGGAK